MMNGVNSGSMDEIERAYAEEYGFGAPPRVTRRVVSLPPAQLGEYTGRYVRIAGTDTTRLDVSVALTSSMLAVYNQSARRSLPLAPLGSDKFVGLEGGGEWTFERRGKGATGPVKTVALGSGPNRRVFVRQ